ncbi:ShlB/FhaC/HecB family hemolysin secretion/activation protein [Burkholderia cepacia]|uniref:ShlB/FhaC/HecB family hemolysin secretion/activation protein n=1 Tax=Burkholderia cepacia TaxID=292 RepID=UPI000A6BCECF|nr:ShlB/FhaC/HecB family hemolysin secretion/activation protein [Burkholderia cepacia]
MWVDHRIKVVVRCRNDIGSFVRTAACAAGTRAVAIEAGRARRGFGRAGGALWLSLLWGAGVAGLPGDAHAQVPNAGATMRDVETSRPSLLPEAAPDLEIGPSDGAAPPPPDTGPRVLVRAFEIGGNTVFDGATLQALVAGLAGDAQSFTDLQRAAGRITAYYRERGYVLARAYLPKQDIENGVVRIEIAEGRYGRIAIENHSRVFDAVLRQPLATLHPGDVVHGASLERSLLLLDDLAGVGVRGTLRAGASPGTTDLVVDAARRPLASGALEFDNFGPVSTGRYRVGGSVDVEAPLRLGDRLSLRGLVSDERQRYYRAAYQVPVGPASTRVGVAYSSVRYRVAGRFAELGMSGRAGVQTVYVAQPLVRSRGLGLTAQIQYENKNLHDVYGAFSLYNDRNVGLWTFGLTGNVQDDWLGGGRSGVSVMFGVGRLRSSDVFASNPLTRSIGSFRKLNLNAQRLQALGGRFQLYGQVGAQLASGNLDSSEKFSLGGPYGVRAYALGEGSGDQGWQASAELRYLAAPGWQVNLFVDAGAVQINRRPWTRERNTQHMQAAGVGATRFGTNHQVALTAALPLGGGGDTPARAPGVWVQAARYF